LDPFPYNGAITSCDAMSMGVPVISLTGDTYVSRQGVMLLSNVGMPELIAGSEEQYAAIASELASDLPRLRAIRSRLPERFAKCPVTDGETFTRHLETAYRRMWLEWCDS
jgi:protein O-GlcNAc transferase